MVLLNASNSCADHFGDGAGDGGSFDHPGAGAGDSIDQVSSSLPLCAGGVPVITLIIPLTCHAFLKGSLTRDFQLLVFFISQFSLDP
jgi:hypothetical protein